MPLQPLNNKEHKLILFFTPKAGCSFGVKWFFYQIGLYEECNNFSRWPHDYRDKVYNKKININLDNSDFDSNAIFLIRHPLKRIVSSYFHSIKHNLEINLISKFLNRDLSSETYSFNEFTQFLKIRNLTNCNIHFQIQSSNFTTDSRFINKHYVRVENLIEDFSNLEDFLNLKKAPHEEISNSLNHHRIKIDNTFNDFCFDKKFSKDDLNNGVPNYKYFYNDKLINDVFKLYEMDFENFDYKPEIK